MVDPRPYKYRYVLLTLCSLECLLLPCVFFGWSSLVYVLKAEGFYLDLCHVAETNSTQTVGNQSLVCTERDLQFSMLFSYVSTAFAVGAFFCGKIQMFAGTRVTRIMCTLVFVAGCCLVAFATPDEPWMLVLGLCLLTPAGQCGCAFISWQTPVLFVGYSPFINAIINGCLDTCTALQFIIKTSYESGVSRKAYFLGLGALSLLTIPTTMILMPKGFIEFPGGREKSSVGHTEEEKEMEEIGQDNYAYDTSHEKDHHFDNLELSQEINVIELASGKSGPAVYVITNGEKMREPPIETTDSPKDTFPGNFQVIELGSIKGDADKELEATNCQEAEVTKGFRYYILSQMCFMHLMWYGVVFLGYFYFLSSLNSHLEMLFASHVEVSYYTDMFQYVQFAAFPVYVPCAWLHSLCYKLSPASAPFEDKAFLASVIPMSLAISFVILMYSAMLVDNTSLLYVAFACYVLFKALMYVSGLSYVTDLFPPRYIGFMLGCMYLMVGVASWAQYGLTYIADEWSPFQARLIIIILCALTFTHPLNTWRRCWQKTRSRADKKL